MLKAALLLVVAVMAIAAVAVYSGVISVAADDPYKLQPVQSLIVMLRDRSIEVRSERITVPDLKDKALIRSGAGNYNAMCVSCHLAPGLDETELSKGLYPAPPNLSQQSITDPAEAFWIIKHGIKATGMPAWGKSMEDSYIWGLVAFLQKLPTLNSEQYQQLVASSDGHSHGSGQLNSHSHGLRTYPQGEPGTQRNQAMDKIKPPTDLPQVIHKHADSTDHVH
nr:cytochrome c [Pseudomonas asuensis]